jgi:hypothetical protein
MENRVNTNGFPLNPALNIERTLDNRFIHHKYKRTPQKIVMSTIPFDCRHFGKEINKNQLSRFRIYNLVNTLTCARAFSYLISENL